MTKYDQSGLNDLGTTIGVLINEVWQKEFKMVMMIPRTEREPEPSNFGHLHQNYYLTGENTKKVENYEVFLSAHFLLDCKFSLRSYSYSKLRSRSSLCSKAGNYQSSKFYVNNRDQEQDLD